MDDKIKILFPAFRVLICLAAIVFVVVTLDIDKWNWRIWSLTSFLLLMLLWSVYGFVLILKRIMHR